ncbi:RNA 2'-phosphotransferase [Mariniflexile rhizosphaerae]|uniref:RNA 2'-phosphotransferase n=1 Tax=unclassified Mariniflexile TaxID=2643887 RepID=UPI000CC27E3D|nr:RNA 2'-phosphotransferase [Mariniflexile sp. TRM1-10]AXP81605.1 RNA 2'-phosphotransferase [Mariniflexile sp. TRM1-10]PLB17589.1 MAG: RNA:NAD 2'-phosphotransferase [Flavobacteriaceae bacterium FS1-H7996/R]
MIETSENNRISKFLSLVLRHSPEKIGLELDSAGWTNVDDLLSKMNSSGQSINFEILQYVVEANKKSRFGFNSDKTQIRANQGHSIEIEHGFKSIIPPEILYHGTGEKSIESILKTGIEKRDRHHVHLSANKETALKVGQRHGKPVVLEILSLKMAEKGHKFYLSENNVWLTDFVPIEFIKRKNNNG